MRPTERFVVLLSLMHMAWTVSAVANEAAPANSPPPAAASASDHSAASPSTPDSASSLPEKPARTSSRDVKIPRALVGRIENEYRAFLTANGVSSKVALKRQLLNISAELTQRNHVALHEDIRVVTPLGGGVVDLSDFVTPLRGAFRLKFLAKQESGLEPIGLRIFFVSRAKSRTVEGETVGSGCDKFMEITSYYFKKAARGGFDLYTAGQRYLSVVGGTFVAIAYSKEALYVGSMTFVDSRYPELLCE